ncbi:Maf family protein [Paracoccaceae bacterium Fryx2]|nr:Maf family protein [Paracoccaceae bacterium Fryx2]
MQKRLILASASPTRLSLLRAAGLAVEALPARIDEETVRAALEAESATPAEISDTLAELKARKIADRTPDSLVLGFDQVLDFAGRVWAKPDSPAAARTQLLALRGKTHRLLSAAVLFEDGRPVWRTTGEARLTMRPFSDAWLDGYLARNWDSLRHAVGGYKLEEEGVQLFSRVEGDYFTVLGLPLLPLLGYLGQRGFIAT